MIYDGECGFCKMWIERWRRLTEGGLAFAPSQEVADRFPKFLLKASNPQCNWWIAMAPFTKEQKRYFADWEPEKVDPGFSMPT